MRRGESDTLNAFNRMDRFEKLPESSRGFGWCVTRHFSGVPPAPSITRHDLSKQGDLLHASRDELSALRHYVVNRAAAFFTSGVRNNAERAVLITSLHDAHECRDRLFCVAVEQVLPDGALASPFFGHIHDLGLAAFKNVTQIIRRVVNFLSSNDQVHV